MPSPPPPTTLQPGDPVWWHDTRTHIGEITHVLDDRRHVLVLERSPDGTRALAARLPATQVHQRSTHIPDVAGPAEARTIMGNISRQRFAELRQQPHFPPAAELAQGPVWARPELLAWHRERTDKRSSPRSRFLMSYRQLGSVYAAAQSLGIPNTTAYRWAHELGLPIGDER